MSWAPKVKDNRPIIPQVKGSVSCIYTSTGRQRYCVVRCNEVDVQLIGATGTVYVTTAKPPQTVNTRDQLVVPSPEELEAFLRTFRKKKETSFTESDITAVYVDIKRITADYAVLYMQPHSPAPAGE